MSAETEEYLAILKASYDYEPQSNDEISIKEDQLLLLKERVDEECVCPYPSVSVHAKRNRLLVGGRSRSRVIHRKRTAPSALFLLPMLNRSTSP